MRLTTRANTVTPDRFREWISTSNSPKTVALQKDRHDIAPITTSFIEKLRKPSSHLIVTDTLHFFNNPLICIKSLGQHELLYCLKNDVSTILHLDYATVEQGHSTEYYVLQVTVRAVQFTKDPLLVRNNILKDIRRCSTATRTPATRVIP